QAGDGIRDFHVTGVQTCALPISDGRTVAFLRSYPNSLALSGRVVRGIADRLAAFDFDRVVGNFANSVDSGARDAVEWSVQRHIRSEERRVGKGDRTRRPNHTKSV